MRLKNPVIGLFNYGGGMRGLIPAYIMSKIEERTKLPMSDMADVFSGPSTGAILNSALNIPDPDNPQKPKYKARHLIQFYEREGIRIFPPDRFREFRGLIHDFNNRTMRLSQLDSIFKQGYYSPAHLRKSLKALYGDHKLSDSLKSLIIPIYNIDGEQLEVVKEDDETGNSPVHTKNNFIDPGGHAIWLKNIKLKQSPQNHKTQNISLYDSVMASTAAPTYFPCHHFTASQIDGSKEEKSISAIDGSIFDNPCISYLGAIRQHIHPSENFYMICLGTGYTNKSVKKEDWNRFGSIGVVDPVNDLPLINIFFHASESALLDTFSDDLQYRLHVFNKSLIGDIGDQSLPNTQIDDASPENMKRLLDFAEIILEENRKGFDQICDLLVSNYEYKKSESRNFLKRFF